MIRTFDILISTLAMVVAALPMLLIALAIYCQDGRPIIFRQTRIGQGGRPFTIFKFRSMRNGLAEHRSGAAALGDNVEDRNKARQAFQTTQAGDPRITLVGRFIRRTHLDELPQFLNVMRGDMSLVGVRPDTPAQEHDYSRSYWIARHIYRPGITGVAQLHHIGGGIDARCASERVWLENRCLKLYFVLLVQTIFKVCKGNSL